MVGVCSKHAGSGLPIQMEILALLKGTVSFFGFK